jgi:hypothetical protein
MLKRYIIKMNAGVEVQLCAFLTSTVNVEMSSFISEERVSGLFVGHETGRV